MPRTLNANGYWEFEAHAETQRFYASETDGHDDNDGLSATPNPTPSGVGESGPKRTPYEAYSLCREGKPDWCMLKKGDVFPSMGGTRVAGGMDIAHNGMSTDDLQLITCYDPADPLVANPETGGARPIVLATEGLDDLIFNNFYGAWGIAGVEFKATIRDLNHADYISGEESVPYICINTIANVTSGNEILFEDVKISFFTYGFAIQSGDNTNLYGPLNYNCTVSEIDCRDDDRANGIGGFYTTNQVVRQCFMHRAGWSPDYPDSNASTNDAFKHCFYLQTNGGTQFHDNISCQDVGGGKLHGLASATGNVFFRSALGFNNNCAFGGEIQRNLVMELIDRPNVEPTGLGPGFGLSLYNVGGSPNPGTDVSDNLFINWQIGSGMAIGCGSTTANLNVQDNVIYGAGALPLQDTGTNNTTTPNDVDEDPSNYPDPTRTMARYVQEVLEIVDGTWEDFVAARLDMYKGNYDERLTAQALNTWFRAGFAMDYHITLLDVTAA